MALRTVLESAGHRLECGPVDFVAAWEAAAAAEAELAAEEEAAAAQAEAEAQAAAEAAAKAQARQRAEAAAAEAARRAAAKAAEEKLRERDSRVFAVQRSVLVKGACSTAPGCPFTFRAPASSGWPDVTVCQLCGGASGTPSFAPRWSGTKLDIHFWNPETEGASCDFSCFECPGGPSEWIFNGAVWSGPFSFQLGVPCAAVASSDAILSHP